MSMNSPHVLKTWPLLMLGLCLEVSCVDQSTPRQLSVFAAASFRDVLPQVTKECGMDVDFQFAGSHILKLQIQHGATADVFLSANQSHIKSLQSDELIDRAVPLVRNGLTIALAPKLTPKASHIATLLEASKIVLGSESSPIGTYTQEWLSTLFVEHPPETVSSILNRVVSYETNTRLVLQRVLQGDADAGVVYQSDTYAFPTLTTLSIPSAQQPDIVFFMGIHKRPRAAQSQVEAFEGCLQTDAALGIFQKYGFESL